MIFSSTFICFYAGSWNTCQNTNTRAQLHISLSGTHQFSSTKNDWILFLWHRSTALLSSIDCHCSLFREQWIGWRWWWESRELIDDKINRVFIVLIGTHTIRFCSFEKIITIEIKWRESSESEYTIWMNYMVRRSIERTKLNRRARGVPSTQWKTIHTYTHLSLHPSQWQ